MNLIDPFWDFAKAPQKGEPTKERQRYWKVLAWVNGKGPFIAEYYHGCDPYGPLLGNCATFPVENRLKLGLMRLLKAWVCLKGSKRVSATRW